MAFDIRTIGIIHFNTHYPTSDYLSNPFTPSFIKTPHLKAVKQELPVDFVVRLLEVYFEKNPNLLLSFSFMNDFM